MWFILVLFTLLILFFVAFFIDDRFFGGNYLNRAKTTPQQLKHSLEQVLAQADRNIEDWDPIPQDWISDKMNIPLKDHRLDVIRMSVAQVIGDSNTFKRLSPEALTQIRQAIENLK